MIDSVRYAKSEVKDGGIMKTWDEVYYAYIVKKKNAEQYISVTGGYTTCANKRLFTKPEALAYVNACDVEFIILDAG